MAEPEEIQKLPLKKQAGYISRHGCYVHFRSQGWCRVDLYWMGSYYAEIWNLYDLKTIMMVRILNEKPCLEPYLDNIKLKLPV